MIFVYTDGSASYKVRDGAWAFVAYKDGTVAELCGFKEETTISEMELLAIDRALEWLPEADDPIRIYSDSQYSVNAVNIWSHEWRRHNWIMPGNRPVKHHKLIASICDRLATHRKTRTVSLIWMNGHRGVVGNERADYLAGEARKKKITNWEPLDGS